jgi:hypothetical protein
MATVDRDYVLAAIDACAHCYRALTWHTNVLYRERV